MNVRILAFAASLRQFSYNRILVDLAARFAERHDAFVDNAHFSEFDMPLFNADAQASVGFPIGAEELKRRLEMADGVLIASPEYNYSIPGTLKNALDWISRFRPMPTRGKTGLLIAASTGFAGGIRGLWQLRIPLEGMGTLLLPDMFALPNAIRAFSADGDLVDRAQAARLDGLVASFIDVTRKLTIERKRPG